MKKVIILSAILIAFVSCKKEASIDYKYGDQPQALNCENIDSKLMNEAYYAFENAIMIHSKDANKNPNANVSKDRSLRNFISRSRGNIRIDEYVTEESVAILRALEAKGLWIDGKINVNNSVVECVANSISNASIKATFNALKSTNSLDSSLIVSTITGVPGNAPYQDKALMVYAALDMYYGKLIGKDFTNFAFLEEKETPEITVKPQADPHAGHNHGPNDGHDH